MPIRSFCVRGGRGSVIGRASAVGVVVRPPMWQASRRSSGRLLEGSIGRQAIGQAAEVHVVRVELRTIDAGVSGHAADHHAAAAAHAGAVDHDRVERDRGRDLVRSSELADGTHHRDRSDGVHGAHPAGVELVLERLGHEPRPAIAAVIGTGDDSPAARQLGLEDDPLARAAADHARDLDPAAGQLLRDREDDRRPDAATDADRVACLEQLGRTAERPRDIGDGVTGDAARTGRPCSCRRTG